MGHSNANNNTKPEQTTKPLSKHGQLEYLLSQLSGQELRQFMLETALQDDALYETILVTFSDLLSTEQTEEACYQQHLHKIINQYTNQDGYISHKNAHSLSAAITTLLNTARKATTPGRKSIDLCTAVISVMPEIGDKMEDREDYLFELMQLACTILPECFDSLKPEMQEACFQRILTLYSEPEYLDLDLDSALLELLKEWAGNNKTRQAECLHQQELMLKHSEHDQWRKNYLLQQTNGLLSYWGKR